MKKSIYCMCGTAMIVIATLTRSLSDGGLELLALMIVGLILLVASADLPTRGARSP